MTKYYVISTDDTLTYYGDMTDEEFITFAIENGQVYESHQDFQKAFNDNDVNSYTDVIRIIVEKPEIQDIEKSVEKHLIKLRDELNEIDRIQFS